MTLYGLKTCDTCRKALKSLRDAGHDVVFHDVRADGLPRETLERFHADLGEELMNKRSSTWRQLGDSAHGQDVISLISQYPAVMKRPVIDDGTRLYLGWTKDVQAALT
ncbi:arsenate reductase [Maribius pontilimi]|uniref:Arsenate reductase n=1 Tax=Palleronia pontilimi TaxID=1964209 RepID=A0A934MGV2_9RHOB|nr:arsenate reductase [Palleronia pontilimi]